MQKKASILEAFILQYSYPILYVLKLIVEKFRQRVCQSNHISMKTNCLYKRADKTKCEFKGNSQDNFWERTYFPEKQKIHTCNAVKLGSIV